MTIIIADVSLACDKIHLLAVNMLYMFYTGMSECFWISFCKSENYKCDATTGSMKGFLKVLGVGTARETYRSGKSGRLET